MRFKVDENLPIDVAEVLRANGHDVMTIFDQKMVGERDPKVASVCKAEDRAIITLDLDFSDIRTYPPGVYPGIIILRPRTQSKSDVLALLASSFLCLAEASRWQATFGLFRRMEFASEREAICKNRSNFEVGIVRRSSFTSSQTRLVTRKYDILR